MNDITKFLNDAQGYEFLWGQPQGSLVVFRNGNVVKFVPLTPNTEDEALRTARNFLNENF